MFFLVKCAFFLALVFMALPWRGGGGPRKEAGGQERAASRVAKPSGTTARARAALADANVLSALARDGAESLTEAARARCLARPRDCLPAAEALRRAVLGPEPGSR